MRGLRAVAARDAYRVRRWDAVVLGSALPGLVAAIRLGMGGLRVLVLEEEAAASGHPGLREPFLMTGSGSDGVLGACLTALGIPLIDRRRIQTDALAYQVALPRARVDVGEVEGTAQELEAWGFASGTVALSALQSLRDAAHDQKEALLHTRLISGNLRSSLAARLAPAATTAHRSRSNGNADPVEQAIAEAKGLAPLFEAQLRALSDFAGQPPSRGVRARLLGGALSGAAAVGDSPCWLRSLLRRRIESRFGEFRQVGSHFQLLSAGNHPALAFDESDDICAARALLINAPLPLLREVIETDATPSVLEGPPASHRRSMLHLQGPRSALPTGMAARVIRVGDLSQPISGTNVVCLRVFENAKDCDQVDLIASAVVPVGALAADVCNELEAAVSSLMPLGREGWRRVADPQPCWDRDGLLADPPGENSWPSDLPLRSSSRMPAYQLDRWRVGALGFEGDLLLGWRAGDAVAASLGSSV
jgi:hypothetical protein